MTLKGKNQTDRWFVIQTWIASLMGVMLYWALPLLKAMLKDNAAVSISDLGMYRLIAAAILALIASYVQDREHFPTTTAGRQRALKNSFIGGLGILALLEQIASTGGVQ